MTVIYVCTFVCVCVCTTATPSVEFFSVFERILLLMLHLFDQKCI